MACGGGGGSGTTTPPEPAERFVISGNNDGTLSIFHSNELAGYATAQAYFPTDGFAIRDIAYDQGNSRIVLITVNTLYVLDMDVDSGNLTEIDNRPTSGNSSHLALNSDASAVYVASGTSSGQAVDMFAIGNSGTLSPANSTTLAIDPDYIKLDPAETYLYVVSRDDAQILIYSINGDNNLVVYDVASDGSLTQSTTFSNSNSPLDMVLNADGSQLYVLDSSNKYINRYSVDNSGALTFVDSTDVSFTAIDITLSHTGEQLYVSHSEDDLVSTIDINANDGSLTVAGWVRAFSSANTVAAVGADGAIRPTATYLLAPDLAGLSVFSTDADGTLTQVTTLNTSGALIDGEVAVDYANGNLSNPNRTGTPANTRPGALAIHPNGRFLYNAESIQDDISTYAISTNNYSLTHQSRVSASGKPSWLEIDPRGQFLYVRFRDEAIQVFSIDATTGDLTDTGQVVSAGSSGGFLPTMTLVAPLQ